jgi:Rho-associated protein kinase 1
VQYYKAFLFKLKQESLQKTIYKLEEQLHNEMQLKDEMEQKCR